MKQIFLKNHKFSQVFQNPTSMRHSETRVAFVRCRHFRCWGGPWVTEFHWVGSASKRGLGVGTCILGFSWVGTPVFSHFECRQARPEGFFGSAPGRRRTEYYPRKIGLFKNFQISKVVNHYCIIPPVPINIFHFRVKFMGR